MDEITVKSTSRVSAECSTISFSGKLGATRLIFRPMLVVNPHDPDAGIKGTLLFQREKTDKEWEDFDTIPMSSLKSGEGYKLEMKSSELLKLFNELSSLYQLHSETGVPFGETKFIRALRSSNSLLITVPGKVADFSQGQYGRWVFTIG